MDEANNLKVIVNNQLKRRSGILTEQDLKDAYQYFDGVCPYSETAITKGQWHLEHIIPVIMGGTTDPWNCIPVCAPCNLSKGGKHLLDWWDLEHKPEEEYKLEKIFNYIVEQLNKPRNYQITLKDQELIEKLLKEENEIELLDENSIYNEDDEVYLDTFTFLYQMLYHLSSNREYIEGNIEEYTQKIKETYNNNLQYERVDRELFKLQNDLIVYLKSINVIQHYSIAFKCSKSSKILNLEDVKNNVDGIKGYLQKDDISDLINKNPDILLMNEEMFSSRLEYIVNILNIPLDVFFDKPAIINQLESLKELYEYCQNENIDFNSIPNYTFKRFKIKGITNIIEVCKVNGIKPEGTVFQQSVEEVQKIIGVCKLNDIEPKGTVFQQPAEEIQKIVEVCKVNGIKPEGTVFQQPAEEIQKIVEVCKLNDIEPKGTVFRQSAEEVQKIIEVCKLNDIELKGGIFKQSAKEIQRIVEVCKENGIEPKGTVFHQSAEELEKIIKICQLNGIEITKSVFQKKAKDLTENINYLKQNYGDEYLKSLIVVISLNKIKKIFSYLESMNVLPVVINSAGILTLSLDDIRERKKVLDYLGEPLVVGNRYNSIFGMDKKRYQMKLESLNIVEQKKR